VSHDADPCAALILHPRPAVSMRLVSSDLDHQPLEKKTTDDVQLRRPSLLEGAIMGRWFNQFAHRASTFAGHYVAFLAALAIIVVWAVTGPLFGFSETWQLVINTGTTIVTFLMVFLIQNTQNRDAMAVHLKLDELINAIEAADDTLMLAEDETVEELEALKQKYEALSRQHDALTSELRQTKSARPTSTSAGS
jgi:low affinity Fe/Cu permease